MKYTVAVGDAAVEVEIQGETVRVNGRPVTVSLGRIPGTPLVQALIDGHPFVCAISRTSVGWEVVSGGETWPVELVDERERAMAAIANRGGHRASGTTIRAPMPGLVLRLEVEIGARVTAGSGLLVLEAMKMENEIKAGRAGTVAAILVQPGQPVEKGTPLVELGEG